MTEANSNNFLHAESNSQTAPTESAQLTASNSTESDRATEAKSNVAESPDWHAIALKLRKHNKELLKQVIKQELAEYQNRLKEQDNRSRSTDNLIAQQAEEINHHREEIARLIHQLELAHQEKYRQETLAENLARQNEASQKQLARVERECALLQEKCNRQTHQILAKKRLTKELEARLQRQQNYTLQYKTVLDRHLKAAVEETDSSVVEIAKPTPIRAWASEEPPTKEGDREVAIVNQQTTNQDSPSSEAKSSLAEDSVGLSEHWPSPIISAIEPEKTNSLLEVDLPTFPRYSHSET